MNALYYFLWQLKIIIVNFLKKIPDSTSFQSVINYFIFYLFLINNFPDKTSHLKFYTFLNKHVCMYIIYPKRKKESSLFQEEEDITWRKHLYNSVRKTLFFLTVMEK